MSLSLVTGTSRGIGRATALACAKRGQRLALLARPSPAQAETEALLRELGADFRSIGCDLRDLSQVEAAAAQVLRDLGTPDVVIHNAGIIGRARVEHTSNQNFREQLDVNLVAPFVLTRELLPHLLQRGSGRILFVASISATLGTAGAAAYCASKWGVLGLMKSLAQELSGTGLMTLAVLPGSVDTEMLSGSGFEPRMSASDVAQTLLYYATEAPLAHNGASIEMFGV